MRENVPETKPLRTLLISLLLYSMFGGALHARTDHEKAVSLARQGQTDRAADMLRQLYRSDPKNRRLLHDLITVLSWGGFDKEALSYRNRIDLDRAPSYLLQAIAKSARNIGAYDYAVKVYTVGSKRYPGIPEFRTALAMTLYDKGAPDSAESVLRRAEKRAKRARERWRIAEVYEYGGASFDAMRIYESLQREREYRERSIKKRFGLLLHLGMPSRAQELLHAYPDLFSEDDVAALQTDLAAFALRWGKRGDYVRPQEKQRLLLEALATIEKSLGNYDLSASGDLERRVVVTALCDKIVALNALGRNAQAILLYESFSKRGVSFADYAKLAVADAYLAKKSAKRAKTVLKELLERDPDNFEAKVLLFYAYSDGYEMNEAIRFAERMDAKEPMKVWDRWHLYKKRNPRKLDAVMLRILSSAYAGHLGDAQRSLEALLAKAPGNGWIRTTLAQIYLYRGWYERAQKQYRIARNLDEQDFTAAAGTVETAFLLREYEEADRGMARLQTRFAQMEPEIEALKKRLRLEKEGGFDLQSLFLDSPATNAVGTYSGMEHTLSLYSALFANRYRFLVDGRWIAAEYDGQRLQNRRIDMGISFSRARFEGSATLGYSVGGVNKIAPKIEVGYRFDDHWSVGGGYSLFSVSTPIRAIDAGIHSDRLFASVDYRASERYASSVSLERSSFSDGNLRTALSLYNHSRLVEGPYYNLASHLYAGVSDNTLQDRPYYNPDRNGYVSLNLQNRWLLTRLYDFHITQIVGIEGGIHWEKGYGSNMTGVLSLGQEWSLSERLWLSFGYRRKRASYDGAIEYINVLYFNLGGKF
ncbi:poly-beta-1,6 N-acetyl-D-glucosamine export porin PgaA [Hydrogenimonas sp.]